MHSLVINAKTIDTKSIRCAVTQRSFATTKLTESYGLSGKACKRRTALCNNICSSLSLYVP